MTIDEAQGKIEEILQQVDQEDMKKANAACITYIKNKGHDTLCLYGPSRSIGMMCSYILTRRLPATVALITSKFVLEYIKDKFPKEIIDTYMSADMSKEIAEIKELEKKEDSTEVNLIKKEKKETPVVIPMSPSKNLS